MSEAKYDLKEQVIMSKEKELLLNEFHILLNKLNIPNQIKILEKTNQEIRFQIAVLEKPVHLVDETETKETKLKDKRKRKHSKGIHLKVTD